jgi:hypothetical protein
MNRKNSMGSFVLKLLSLAFVIIFIAGYCELGLRKVQNGYTFKKVKFEKNLKNIELLVVGSSEPLYGINPSFLEPKSFNLANVSQSLYYDKELLMAYINGLPKIKTVIISISYFSLWYDIYNNSIENWRDYYYYHFWKINTNSNEPFNIKKYSYISLYGTDFTQQSFFENFQNLPDLTDDNGYLADSGILPASFTDADAHNRVGEHDRAMKESSLKSNLLYLREILSFLKSKRINAILVTCPVTKRYFSYTDASKNKFISESINLLCKEYGGNYLYYMNDERFTDNDFWDFDHLNVYGAEKFTRILNTDIKEMLSLKIKE